MKYVNTSLITLKCVLFLFFGAMGCLLPFLPLHMMAVGLSHNEIRTISIVAPVVAILGPLVAGPAADRLAGSNSSGGGKPSRNGKYLRIMIAVCLIFAVVFYWLLMAVPAIIRTPPTVMFTCDNAGGIVRQERCGAEKTCYDWNAEKRGSLYVSHCKFTCHSDFQANEYATTIDPDLDISGTSDENDLGLEEDYDEHDIIDEDTETPNQVNHNTEATPHPHLCYRNTNGSQVCEVYTKYSKPISLHVSLNPNREESTTSDDKDNLSECKYSIGSDFFCRMPPDVMKNLTKASNSCQPIVQCNLYEPYASDESILHESECVFNNISFWLYLVLRSLADIFPAAAVTLLGV